MLPHVALVPQDASMQLRHSAWQFATSQRAENSTAAAWASGSVDSRYFGSVAAREPPRDLICPSRRPT
jgi:hypothetical protein